MVVSGVCRILLALNSDSEVKKRIKVVIVVFNCILIPPIQTWPVGAIYWVYFSFKWRIGIFIMNTMFSEPSIWFLLRMALSNLMENISPRTVSSAQVYLRVLQLCVCGERKNTGFYKHRSWQFSSLAVFSAIWKKNNLPLRDFPLGKSQRSNKPVILGLLVTARLLRV